MDQYTTDPSQPPVAPKEKNLNRDLAKDLVSVRQELENQKKLVQDLEREVRKLKNDLRLAINNFNIKHG